MLKIAFVDDVLLLEPDAWRFRGMSVVLEDVGDIRVVGERDYGRVLVANVAPSDVLPDVVVLAHRLIVEYGWPLIARVKELFRGVPVLVHGDEDSVELSAEIFAAGASGYFNMSAPPGGLPRAVTIVARGKMWGPREAIALMAHRLLERPEPARTDIESADLLLLRHLHEGLSNKEIAGRLHVAEVTVKVRLGRLYRKFGVNTRLQLLTTAIREGMVV
jgi:two-component system response regulator DevR